MRMLLLHAYDNERKGYGFIVNPANITRIYAIHTDDEKVKHSRVGMVDLTYPIAVFESPVEILRLMGSTNEFPPSLFELNNHFA